MSWGQRAKYFSLILLNLLYIYTVNHLRGTTLTDGSGQHEGGKIQLLWLSVWFSFQAAKDASYFLTFFFICQNCMYSHALYTSLYVSFLPVLGDSLVYILTVCVRRLNKWATLYAGSILSIFSSICFSLPKSIPYILTKMETFMICFSVSHPIYI